MDELTTSDALIVRKAAFRIVPLMALCYFVNYLDRVNIGFAALTMNKDLGLSATQFGWGAGLFFLSYFAFEVPSSYAMQRFGTRNWIVRIMVSWGIISAAAAFAQGPLSFYFLRFLLGAAEAGFFPAAIFYVMYWFPRVYRVRITALFMTAIPLSGLLGSPLSAWLLSRDGIFGLSGWRWMFIVEGLPACALGLAVALYLPKSIKSAAFLTLGERQRLDFLMSQEVKAGNHVGTFWRSVVDVRVLTLAVVQMGFTVASYGIGIWLPQILVEHNLSIDIVGLLSALPYLAAVIGMILWGKAAQKRSSSLVDLVFACVVGGLGMLMTAATSNLWFAIIGISASLVGNMAARPLFWPVPTLFLTGNAAAGGIAMINSAGNLGGFLGPWFVGIVKDQTGSFTWGMLLMAGFMFLAAALSQLVGVMLRRSHKSPVHSGTQTRKEFNNVLP